MNWTVWIIIHILGFITSNFLHICVMIIAGLFKFQALIWTGVSIGKCLTSIQIRHMVRLFEFYCECTAKRRHFKNLICVIAVFFAFTVYFASNPFTEFCYIYLNCTAVRLTQCSVLEITVILTSCTIIFRILRDLVHYCAVRSTLVLIPVDVPFAVNFLWLHIQFSSSLRT